MLALLGLVLHAMTVEAARWEGADGLDVVSGEVVEAAPYKSRWHRVSFGSACLH